MKRRGASLFMVLILAVAAAFLAIASIVSLQKAQIARLEKSVQSLKEEIVPLRFMVVSRSEGVLRARVRIYDLAGNEVDLLEAEWPGSELCFDFSVVPVAGRYLAFPRRIFTERIAPSSGTNLYPRYDRSGFPAIFEGGDFQAAGRRKLVDLFRILKEEGEPSGSFGSVVHDLARIASFETGVVYRVAVHPKGGIEILED